MVLAGLPPSILKFLGATDGTGRTCALSLTDPSNSSLPATHCAPWASYSTSVDPSFLICAKRREHATLARVPKSVY